MSHLSADSFLPLVFSDQCLPSYVLLSLVTQTLLAAAVCDGGQPFPPTHGRLSNF